MEVWQTSNLRRLRLGEEKKKKEEERTKHSMKIYMVSLLHRATIKNNVYKNLITLNTNAQLSHSKLLWFTILIQ